MNTILNQRQGIVDGPVKRRMHVLVEFPDPRLESIVIQWEKFRPTMLVQLKRNPDEPAQFPGKRADVPGNAELAVDKMLAIDLPLLDFVDPATGLIFGREAFNADLVFSARAFTLLQPEPDLVLPVGPLWECRTEALQALGVPDTEGTGLGRGES